MTMPILASVPHAGTWVPPEVRDICVLTPQEIVDDGDVGAAEIYAISTEVEAFVTTEVARAIVDLNRAEDDFWKDGVIKTHTCWDVPVYSTPPSEELIENLLAAHHRPYHDALTREAASSRVVLGVDCHTMAAMAPPVAPDPGKWRPMVCLSNGDGTLPDRWFDTLYRCFVESFPTWCEVTRNEPFRGGYIIRTHARELPWVQLELSRTDRLSNTQKRMYVLKALRRWCSEFLPTFGRAA